MFAISPLDGRYGDKVVELQDYFSEFALVKRRVHLELNYLLFVLKVLGVDPPDLTTESMENVLNFDESSYRRVKQIESITNHDVKAVEIFIRENMELRVREYVHIGLTSHDVNNVCVLLNIEECNRKVMYPLLENTMDILKGMATNWKDIPMLAHTHGQPATPTTLGKEIMVYWYRFSKQYRDLCDVTYYCKFGGASGNMNAHKYALGTKDNGEKINWPQEMDDFISSLTPVDCRGQFTRDQFTTQLSNYDDLSKLLGIYQRLNTIMIDMCQDMWLYISMRYFKLRVVQNEVGSSTMPHKVNPIQFENAEGNLKLANALIQFMQLKLPVSRLQRDLTDSTVIRNMGTIFGHILQSYKSILSGLSRIEPNGDFIAKDLADNYVVIAEGIQTKLRLYDSVENAYDTLKSITRTSVGGGGDSNDRLKDFIKSAAHTFQSEEEDLTPQNYIGFAKDF